MRAQRYITIPKLAKLLGVSRIMIYKRVRRGDIPAVKVGKTYVITDKTVNDILAKALTADRRKTIDAAVRRTIKEYGEVLIRLGKKS